MALRRSQALLLTWHIGPSTMKGELSPIGIATPFPDLVAKYADLYTEKAPASTIAQPLPFNLGRLVRPFRSPGPASALPLVSPAPTCPPSPATAAAPPLGATLRPYLATPSKAFRPGPWKPGDGTPAPPGHHYPYGNFFKNSVPENRSTPGDGPSPKISNRKFSLSGPFYASQIGSKKALLGLWGVFTLRPECYTRMGRREWRFCQRPI